MMEDVTAGAAKAVLSTASVPAAAPGAAPKTAPSEAVEAFHAALAKEDAAGTAGVVPPANAATIHATGDAPLGDKILHSLQSVSREFQDAVGQVNAQVQDNEVGLMRPDELLKTQLEVTRVTMEQDLLGKVAGKATSTMDTFLKNQ